MHKIDYSIKQKGAELSTGKLVKASTCMGPAVHVTVCDSKVSRRKLTVPNLRHICAAIPMYVASYYIKSIPTLNIKAYAYCVSIWNRRSADIACLSVHVTSQNIIVMYQFRGLDL